MGNILPITPPRDPVFAPAAAAAVAAAEAQDVMEETVGAEVGGTDVPTLPAVLVVTVLLSLLLFPTVLLLLPNAASSFHVVSFSSFSWKPMAE